MIVRVFDTTFADEKYIQRRDSLALNCAEVEEGGFYERVNECTEGV